MQMSLFDGQQDFHNDKPIRLIELFGGYGSQALALKYLGIPFEHYRLSEWAVKSIQAYKDLHNSNDYTNYSHGKSVEEIREWLYGRISSNYNTPLTEQQINRLSEKQVRTIYNNMQATHNLGSITQINAEDLAIVDTDKFTYIITYSFPCQDLSNAGQQKGMTKGSGTRSGLLWEVERLLGEMTERPQILLMENVPNVVGSTGIKDFAQWIARLEEQGFLIGGMCVANDRLKMRPLRNFYKSVGECERIVGIAFDEPERLERLHGKKNTWSILEREGIVESATYDICRKYNLLSPTYQMRSRGGCWFCPNCGVKEFANFAKEYPHLWAELEKLSHDKEIVSQGFKYGRTFESVNREVWTINNQMSIFDN